VILRLASPEHNKVAKKATSPSTAAKPPAAKASASSKPAFKRTAAKDAEVTPTPVAKSPKSTIVTLKQLAVQLSESQQMPTKQVQAMLDNVVSLLVDHLKAGSKFRVNGLGILQVKDRPARTRRNPATGEAV